MVAVRTSGGGAGGRSRQQRGRVMAEQSYRLTVRAIVRETVDASSVTFDVPPDLAETFRFEAGQFLTLAIPSDRTGLVARCYSLCVPPGEPLTVTVKRTPDGFASHWINDELRPGDTLRVLPPSGIFTPTSLSGDLLLWAGGSGITPVMSILRTALSTGTGQVVLFYANRDEPSVIFADRLRKLEVLHPDRLLVQHWLESDQGLPTTDVLREFARPRIEEGYESMCCGPAPFMASVHSVLRSLDVPRSRRHQERFVSLGSNPFED